MPNYCFNSLRIVGPAEEIAEFLKHDLSFQHFVPCPVEKRNMCWGTKWEAIDFQIIAQEETMCQLKFLTAWGPPIRFLAQLNALYPACWFKLLFEVEGGWGSGLWIHYYHPTSKKSVERLLEWKEPFMGSEGLVLSEDESEGEAVHPVSRPEFLEPLPSPPKLECRVGM